MGNNDLNVFDNTNSINEKIKQMVKKSFNLQIVKSFAGKSLEEICAWYPFMITKEKVIDYAIQTRQFELLAEFAAYEKNPTISRDDTLATTGLINFVHLVNELSHRVCFMMFQLLDNWEEMKYRKYLFTKSPRKELIGKYTQTDYAEYIDELGGSKHFITKSEFEKFLKDVKSKITFVSINDLPFSVDSLLLTLLQHYKEYNLTMEKILTEVIPKGDGSYQHEGIANDFIHLWNVARKEYDYDSRFFNENVIFHDFFIWQDFKKDVYSN